jgi:uncharacterized protein with HEPN domain
VKGTRTVEQFLQDIVEWGERAVRHVSNMTRDQFLTDEKTQDAVSRCIEAIGEAANRAIRLDPSIVNEFPEFEADRACAARNVRSHDYFRVDPAILWSTVMQSVPKMVTETRRILDRGRRKTS